MQALANTLEQDAEGEAGTSVSLLIGGTILSGKLISRAAYLARSFNLDRTLKSPREGLDPLAQALRNARQPAWEENDEAVVFFMRDVRVMQGGNLVRMPLTIWQGVIGLVDAITIGELEEEPGRYARSVR